MRLRKFAIRSFCRSAQVKTEEGFTIKIPSIHHPLTTSLDGKWGRRRTISSGSASFSVHVDHGRGSMRARSSSTPARPYIARLRVFSLLICPSAWPLLHVSVIAFFTASTSR